MDVGGKSSNPALAFEFRLIGSETPNPCSFDDAIGSPRALLRSPTPLTPARSGRSSCPRLSVKRDRRLREPPPPPGEEPCE